MKYEITYKLYDDRTGKPFGKYRYYECKDAADYARCVQLYKDGEVYLVSVNGRKVSSQNYYPSRRSQELERSQA